MKAVFLTKFDFTSDRKDGGLEISARNYGMVEKFFSRKNVILCIVTPYDKKDYDNIYYFKTKTDIVHSYLTYFQLRDRISASLEKKIVETINEYAPDFLFLDGSTFGQVLTKLRPIKYSCVYFHNIERQYTWDQVRKHSIFCIFRYWATRHNERKIIDYTPNYICMNERDNSLLKKFYGRTCNFIFPATYSDHYVSFRRGDAKCDNIGKFQLLFIGSYFAHNYTGLCWFIEEVLPFLDCELVVVGKNMENMREKVNNPKVKIIGTVDNLEEYYLSADAMVMPIFMGGGMKVKTAEALMYGKTLFASTEALEGYDVSFSKTIFRCDNKQDFIRKISDYMSDDNRSKFNQENRDLFLNGYCTEQYYDKFVNYIQSIIC